MLSNLKLSSLNLISNENHAAAVYKQVPVDISTSALFYMLDAIYIYSITALILRNTFISKKSKAIAK